MSLTFKTRDIALYTGVPLRTVQRVLGLWRRTGQPYRARRSWVMGRPRSLDLEDIQVCSLCVHDLSHVIDT